MKVAPNSALDQQLTQALVSAQAHNRDHGGAILRVEHFDETLLWEKAIGHLAGPDTASIGVRDQFEVASITKMFTAVVTLQLIEEGRFTLGASIGALFPSAQLPKHLRNHRAELLEGVTVEDLLRHTSGFSNFWEEVPPKITRERTFLQAFLAERDRFWQPHEVLSYVTRDEKKSHKHGHLYSDANYITLGLLLEALTGKSLQTLFHERIFGPLKMKHTFMSYREPKRGGYALSHRYEDALDLHGETRQSADWAGGGLVSDSSDLLQFLRGLARGTLFHKAETLPWMLAFQPTEEEGVGYGLGLYRVALPKGAGHVWGHDGHGNAFAFYWPDKELLVSGTLNQLENDWWPLYVKIVSALGHAERKQ